MSSTTARALPVTAAPSLPSANRPYLDTLAAAVCVLLWLACTAWMRPLLTPDEGRYVGVAFEMLRSGQWLTPVLNGLPFFHKPPLFYWVTATSLDWGGLTELTARAAPLLGGWLLALALYLFTRHWCGLPTARRTLCVLLVQPLLFVGAQYANLDMLVAGCISATVLVLAHAALRFEAGQPYRRALLGAYALAAFGVLAKGLIGFVIPSAVLGLWLLLRWRWKTLWALLSLPGTLLFLLIAAPWFLLMEWQFPDFLHYFFVVQHFQRFSVGGFNNAMPLWFYPAVLGLFSLPCLLWAGGLLRPAHWRSQAATAQGAIGLLMVVWLVTVLAFFSIPKSKLVGYVLPAVAPLVWLMSDAAGRAVTSGRRLRAWLACVALSALLGLVPVLWLTLSPGHSLRAMGQFLQAQRQAPQPVFMLNDYFYDLPFYARLSEPVVVVDDWGSEAMKARDNWRKELAEAGAFAPDNAQRLLLRPELLPLALCQQPVSWIVADPYVLPRYPFLAQAQAVFTAPEATLWRLERRALTQCAKKPNAD